MSIKAWQHFFKPEIRSSGESFVTQGKAFSSRLSDTEVQTFIRASSSAKVTLKTPSVDSVLINADCNCPFSQKGHFCKHIWAALLMTEEKFSDFLDSKAQLERKSEEIPARSVKSDYKTKQADYRKEQYQKQKQRLKEQKAPKKSRVDLPAFPEKVDLALKYFSENGFNLSETMSTEAIGQAKKKLSRVFHPDKGGSHKEIQELNEFSEILIQYVSR